jgi:hypothetical protein
MGGTVRPHARCKVVGHCGPLKLSGARAEHPSASGCGRRWRARPHSKDNSKLSVQASAGFIMKSGDRLPLELKSE